MLLREKVFVIMNATSKNKWRRVNNVRKTGGVLQQNKALYIQLEGKQ